MIDRLALKYVYQPISDLAAKRSLCSCYRLSQQCAVLCAISQIGWAVGTYKGDLLAIAIQGPVTLIWVAIMYGWWRDAEKMNAAMMAGKPTLSHYATQEIFSYFWLGLLPFDLGAAVVGHGVGGAFHAMVDVTYLSVRWFILCKPMRPRTKPAKIPANAILST